MNTPDFWVVIKINNEFYKVFATWIGGYSDGDAWKVNSGISKVTEDEGNYYFHGKSGSVYKCSKKGYKVGTSYTGGVLYSMIEQAKERDVDVQIMPSDTDWLNLLTTTVNE